MGETGLRPVMGAVAPEWIPAYAGMTERYAPRPQYPLPPHSRRPLPL